jgi:hypothetical protein
MASCQLLAELFRDVEAGEFRQDLIINRLRMMVHFRIISVSIQSVCQYTISMRHLFFQSSMCKYYCIDLDGLRHASCHSTVC